MDMIKIDVEGAELKVLRGAVNTLKRDKPIVLSGPGLCGAADELGRHQRKYIICSAIVACRYRFWSIFLRGKLLRREKIVCSNAIRGTTTFLLLTTKGKGNSVYAEVGRIDIRNDRLAGETQMGRSFC